MMDLNELKGRFESAIQPVFADSEFDLVETVIKRRGRDLVIEVFADRPAGGINLEECAGLNKGIASTIEQKNFFDCNYELFVSSPGMDRPLKSVADFLRVLNRKVRIEFNEQVEDLLEYTGIVAEVNENDVTLKLPEQEKRDKKKRNPAEIKVPFLKIKRAVQTI